MLEGKCEKNGVPKVLSSHHWKNISEQKQSNNARKETWKKNEEGKWNEKKKKQVDLKWRETKKEDQSRIGPSHSEKWPLVWSPWNTVWAYLSFLSKP